ncbi:MAG: hypothetical protein HQ564_10235 [Candidatus Saganbacteria bacterium]|nr:hypothetical protein [Candidatus Saganbacteria bacterium]
MVSLSTKIQQGLQVRPISNLSVSQRIDGLQVTSITQLPMMLVDSYAPKINSAVQRRFDFTLLDVLWDERAKQAILASPTFLDELDRGFEAAMALLQELQEIEVVLIPETKVLMFLADQSNKRAAGLVETSSPVPVSPPIAIAEISQKPLWQTNEEKIVSEVREWLEENGSPVETISIEELVNRLELLGAVGSFEDSARSQEFVEKFLEAKEEDDVIRVREAAEKANVLLAARFKQKDELVNLLKYEEARAALVELADESDIPLMNRMLVNPDQNLRITALMMMRKLGSRKDLPRVIKRIRSDKDKGVLSAAIETFAKLAQREDLPIIREILKLEEGEYGNVRENPIRTAAARALARIVTKEDSDIMKRFRIDYSMGTSRGIAAILSEAAQNLVSRDELDFDEVKELMGDQAIYTVYDVLEIDMEAFVKRIVTVDDIDFVNELVDSKNSTTQALGLRAYFKLLTEYEIDQLIPFLSERKVQQEVSRSVPPAATEAFVRLAQDDNLSEISSLLDSRNDIGIRAALLALSKPDLAEQIPPGVKQLIKGIAERKEKPSDLLKSVLTRLISEI